MRVAAIQMKARGTWEASLQVLRAGLGQVGEVDLVVAPELALRGYAFNSRRAVREAAEPPDGPTWVALSKEARRLRTWIVVGFPELDGEALYNSALVIGPDGALEGVYRKTMLFEADQRWACAGMGSYPVVDTGAGRFSVGICMDLNDDAFLAGCAHEAVDVIAFPTNWIQEEGEVHPYWQARLRAGWPAEYLGLPGVQPDRARYTGVLVGANSYGREGVYTLAGRSAVLTDERILASAPPTGEAVLVVDTGGATGGTPR